MAKATWSAQAKQELKDLITYLKQHNRASAVEASTEIKAISRLLARRPFIGRPARSDSEREFSISRWSKVFVYRITPDGIDISTLRDPRMQPRPDDTEA